MKFKTIRRIRGSNKRGMFIYEVDCVKTPFFYVSTEGFVMNQCFTIKDALKLWNFDNST